MLMIRPKQLEMFEETAKQRFADRMVAFLNEEWQRQCAERGEEEVRCSIKTGIARAEKYSLTTENQIAKYINLMYALAFDFDKSPDTPWAGTILNDESLDPNYKIKCLYRLAASV
jgi:hypothetical protein